MSAPSKPEPRSSNDGAARPQQHRLRLLRVLPQLDFGGVESRVVLQSRLHDRNRFELMVAGFHRRGAAARAIEDLGVPVFELGVNPSPRSVLPTLSLVSLLRRLRPDIVHASIAEANVHAVLAARSLGIPVVMAEETGMPSHRAAARLVFRGVYHLSDAVVGVTRAVCDYVGDVDRAPRHKVKLVYNCANPSYFSEPPAPIASRADEPKVILLVGRLVPVKNHAMFLRAFAGSSAASKAEVHFVGDGPLRDELDRMVVGLGLQDRVRFLGLRSDVRDLLLKAHAFALPSLSEGCSISLIEAMASGVPALGSRVPGIVEVMGAQAPDWTAAPQDVPAWTNLIERCLVLTPAERTRVGSENQRIAYAGFSPHSYIKNVQCLYEELWAKRQRPRHRPRRDEVPRA